MDPQPSTHRSGGDSMRRQGYGEMRIILANHVEAA